MASYTFILAVALLVTLLETALSITPVEIARAHGLAANPQPDYCSELCQAQPGIPLVATTQCNWVGTYKSKTEPSNCFRYLYSYRQCDRICRESGSDWETCIRGFQDIDFTAQGLVVNVRYCKDAHPIAFDGIQLSDVQACAFNKCTKVNPFTVDPANETICSSAGNVVTCADYLNSELECGNQCAYWPDFKARQCIVGTLNPYCANYDPVWSNCLDYKSIDYVGTFTDTCNPCNFPGGVLPPRPPFLPPCP